MSWKGWWFSSGNRRLGYGDGRLAKPGIVHELSRKRPLTICEYGLHASKYALDALMYINSFTPGGSPARLLAWRVELRDKVVQGVWGSKYCAYERRYIGFVPRTMEVLREFLIAEATRVLPLWPSPPESVVRYLRGDLSCRRSASATVKRLLDGMSYGDKSYEALECVEAALEANVLVGVRRLQGVDGVVAAERLDRRLMLAGLEQFDE